MNIPSRYFGRCLTALYVCFSNAFFKWALLLWLGCHAVLGMAGLGAEGFPAKVGRRHDHAMCSICCTAELDAHGFCLAVAQKAVLCVLHAMKVPLLGEEVPGGWYLSISGH